MIPSLMIITKLVIEKEENNSLTISLENNKKTLILQYGLTLTMSSLKYW